MSKRVKIIVSVVAAVFVLSTVGATVIVMAQEGETEPEPAEEAGDAGLLARVAAILGISEETLASAFRQAGQEMVDEALAKAVDEGRITEEQAEQLRDRWEQARDRVKRGLMFRRLLRMDEEAVDELLVKLIDEGRIDFEQAGEIKAKWEQTRDRIKRAFIFRRMMRMDEEELDEALAKAIEEGQITSEQAERIKERWQQRHQALESDCTRARMLRARIARAVPGRRMIALRGGMQRMRLHRLAD